MANWKRLLLAAGLVLAAPMAWAQDRLAQALAIPLASELTGARDVARFAWIDNIGGARSLWVADAKGAPRRIAAEPGDDGEMLYDPVLSRDGSRVAWVRGGDEEFPDGSIPNTGVAPVAPKQQVMLAPADGSGAPVVLGEGHSPVFAPDGTQVAFSRRGEIWLWDGGAARKVATVAGTVGRLQWAPDGTRLLFIDDRGDHSFVALLDIAGGTLRHVDPGLGTAVEPVFSPDGSRIAFIRYLDPPPGAGADAGPYWSLRVADAATGATRVLWSAPQGPGGRYAGTRSRNLFWSADNRIVFPWEGSGWIHPYAIDADRGGTPRDLTPGAFEVETFLLAPDGRSLVYAANAGDLDRRHLWRVALSGGAPQRVTGGTGIESFPTFAGATLATIATDATHPAHPALAEGLAPMRAAPALADIVQPQAVVLRAEDGVAFHAQLFAGRGPGKHPALIFVHGGPRRQMLLGFHAMGYYSNAYAMNQALAAKGYTVLSVNYRSGTGYGRAFRDAAETGRDGASEYRDVLAAGRWLAARGDVDAKRIGIWGGSWGGYLTALALARNSDLFAAGADFHGVHTLVRPGVRGVSPEAEAAARAMQWQASPMASLGQWRSPVLLVHGDDDKNVEFGQSVLLARELAARRIPYRELVFPNERHEFFRTAHWLAAYRATIAFFDEVLAK
ncbi:S9 family peptidase [Sphingomonas hengshuiensis]|uniref:Acyl-peptide hydrolase n=1 Tax=Sphingomonas hengshuiensis TaxID=1609977 RepID=A0A7U4JA56_9SPHN|nr:alpha/beta fold hydrolase [Sphingomonas hengshuiensis]AJP73054.1 peptidase S9 [Sphingomonas hengshuiensis]